MLAPLESQDTLSGTEFSAREMTMPQYGYTASCQNTSWAPARLSLPSTTVGVVLDDAHNAAAEMSGGYDERLLASAPVATRAEKQEGYDINLFKEQPNEREPTVSPPPLPVLSANHSSAEVAGYSPYAQPPAAPWYRTRKWLFIFFFAAIVVIAAVIGGAVGGTVGHNKGGAVVATQDGGGAEGPASSNSTQTVHHDHDAGQTQSSNSTASATGSDGGGS